jgi:hypothetical protein
MKTCSPDERSEIRDTPVAATRLPRMSLALMRATICDEVIE